MKFYHFIKIVCTSNIIGGGVLWDKCGSIEKPFLEIPDLLLDIRVPSKNRNRNSFCCAMCNEFTRNQFTMATKEPTQPFPRTQVVFKKLFSRFSPNTKKGLNVQAQQLCQLLLPLCHRHQHRWEFWNSSKYPVSQLNRKCPVNHNRCVHSLFASLFHSS